MVHVWKLMTHVWRILRMYIFPNLGLCKPAGMSRLCIDDGLYKLTNIWGPPCRFWETSLFPGKIRIFSGKPHYFYVPFAIAILIKVSSGLPISIQDLVASSSPASPSGSEPSKHFSDRIPWEMLGYYAFNV